MYGKVMLSAALLFFSSLVFSQGFDESYEVFKGDLNGDNLTDLYIKGNPKYVLLHGNIVTPVTVAPQVEEFVLTQNQNASFDIVSNLSGTQLATVSGWPEAALEVVVGDFNADKLLDIFLRGLYQDIPDVFDVVVHAPANKFEAPSSIFSLNTDFHWFLEDIFGYMLDPSYYAANGTYQVCYYSPSLIFDPFGFGDNGFSSSFYNVPNYYCEEYFVPTLFSSQSLNFSGASGYSQRLDALEAILGLVLPEVVEAEVGGIVVEVATVLVVAGAFYCAVYDPETCTAVIEDMILDGTVIDYPWGDNEEDDRKKDNLTLGMLLTLIGMQARVDEGKENDIKYCTYQKEGFVQGVQKTYSGRTRGKSNETDQQIVARRDARHWVLNGSGDYGAAVPKGCVLKNEPSLTNFSQGGYSAIRGREQQLIDEVTLGADIKNSNHVANKIRGVAKNNPRGCDYWKASTQYFGLKWAYTGNGVCP